ncbi:MAG: DUF3160 domain-containing protein [Bacteroidota bacterium]
MKKLLFLVSLFALPLFWTGCSEESAKPNSPPAATPPAAPETRTTAPAQAGEFSLSRKSGPGYEFYREAEFIDYWGEPLPTPDIDYAMDLTGRDVSELRLLRATIEARKGETFRDDQLRQHFMNQDWYQPPFWNHDFVPQFNAEEMAFMDRVRTQEAEMQRAAYDRADAAIRTSAINNRFRFSAELLEDIEGALDRYGVATVPTKNEQMFHIYDKNDYQAIPSFVTSDFYLQLMSLYFSRILQELETDVFAPIIEELLETLVAENEKDLAEIPDPTWQAAAEYNLMFFGIARELITNQSPSIPERLRADYNATLAKIREARGQGSKLLKSEFFDFSLFKPRGHYTRSEALKNYFRAMTWLQIAPANVDHPVSIHAAMVTATHFLENKALLGTYNRLSAPVAYLVGEPNRNSIINLFSVMQNLGMPADPVAFFSPEYTEQVKQQVQALGIGGFKNKSSDADTEEELQKFTVYFMPQRYTLDAEILIRLVDVERENLKTPPKRPFPKGLDVMAALGSETAQDILLNEYREAEKWPAYPDSLAAVRAKFENYPGWDENGYNQWIHLLQSLLKPSPNLPKFVYQDGWKLKSLNTALGSWTELKHNTLLYADQPMAAQLGSGGEEWPASYVAGYVEPDPVFWQRADRLLRSILGKLEELQLLTDNIEQKTKRLLAMGDQLRAIVDKQLTGTPLTGSENDFLRYIGADAEWLSLNLMDKENISWYELNAVDKFMALVADVYTYQGDNQQGVLEEAIGYADEIYVPVPMPDGSIQLCRGAVFSYYEFVQPIDQRLTDEEWQQMLIQGSAPDRPDWVGKIFQGEVSN